ncbi:hypothetical protein CVT24_008509 [Panaeolus cyanescens]|uniref:Uncharacterized protein n=1 Tax=Panaeolus cyanescens TaxID=181874 RepID=A0A409W4C8_9AGAR|nr:hypothetical protein CVT24_008509 [Panaeolus cyanescens]
MSSLHRCACKRTFNTPAALKTHRARCMDHKTMMKGSSAAPASSTANPPVVPAVQPLHVPVPSSSSNRLKPSGPTFQLSRQGSSIPQTFHDIVPPAPPLDEFSNPGHGTSASDPSSEHKTPSNKFGVFRVYQSIPTFNPDADFNPHTLYNNPSFEPSDSIPEPDSETLPPPPGPFPNPSNPPASTLPDSPYPNRTIDLIMSWFYTASNTKSLSDLNILVHNVLLSDEFKKGDLEGFDAGKIAQMLDNITSTKEPLKDGWKRAPIALPLPFPKNKVASEDDAPVHVVEDLFYRKLTDVITSAYAEPSASELHSLPFEEYWSPGPNTPPERIYSELYNSDALIKEQDLIHQLHRSSSPHETVVMPIMLWSDSTMLAKFGDASLWPAYLFNGYQSKYSRAKPTSYAAHHIAYIPKLDDAIHDSYRRHFNSKPSPEVLTHLRRELMQAVWGLLLDDDFLKAYKDGIDILFPDGVYRRVFPRFFTYSADYPEKVLLTCIKFLGNHPCTRCSIHKDHIHELGTIRDQKRRLQTKGRTNNAERQALINTVRRLIFVNGYSVNSKAVTNLLEPYSWTPTRNAFGDRLGLDFYKIFVVDLLHEFELGVWKATFIHLLRILFVAGPDLLQVLNSRYRLIPAFGRAIRRFSSNASAMKQLAARDFEDLLQCIIPVFEGLLEAKHDAVISSLLFELATWHSLAKLRLHTESTVKALEASTTRLGTALRKFKTVTCAEFRTVDLPTKEAARARRRKTTNPTKATTTAGPKDRKFNLSTYKLHALGDYPTMIRLYGPTDGYSTQTGELEHRRCKHFYPRVHKGKKHYVLGVAKQIPRQRRLHNLGKTAGIQMARANKKQKVNSKRRKALADERLLPSRASEHYQIPEETRNTVPIGRFLSENSSDPALKNFLPRLKDHILGRLLNQRYDGDDNPFSSAQRAQVLFRNHTMFEHKTLQVNYTTYDMRREQDTLNPRTNPNIMVLSPDDQEHPYWYAKIIGIYHVLVVHHSLQPEPKLMHFPWVRWYGMEPSKHYKYGWKAQKLPRIGFVDDSSATGNTPHSSDTSDSDSSTNEDLSSPAFGFIDPANVIRAVHLIPAFHHGHTKGLLGASDLARQPEEEDSDWNFFYVNIFADRDMMMRFRGGGVGHLSTRAATNWFLSDRPKGETCGNDQDGKGMDIDLESGDSSSESGSEAGSDVQSGQEEMSESGGGDKSEVNLEVDSEDEVDDIASSDEEQDYGYRTVSGDEWEDESEDELVDHDQDDLPVDIFEHLGFSGY